MAGRAGKCRAWVTPLLALGFWLTPSIQAQTARNPHGPISIPCENCHTTTSFSPLRAQPEFDHNQTQFPLRGMHQNVACNSCHVSRVFTEAGTQCATCHADFHRRQFGAQCENCHTVQGWRVATRSVQDHLNRFPLVGRSRGGGLRRLPSRSRDGRLYGPEYAVRHMPRSSSFSRPRAWITAPPVSQPRAKPATTSTIGSWRVSTTTSSRSSSSREPTPRWLCASCHVGGHYQGTVATCVGCHSKDFAATTNPNHVTAGFPQTCETCHNTTQWLGATFDHNMTKFPLTGKHTTVACATCHSNGQYATLPTTCVSCHLPDYQKTTTPNHVAASFPQTCETCHSTTQWLGAVFDHNTTKFPLTGKHTTVACATCHIERPIRDAADDLRVVPLAGLPEDDDSQPRRREFPADLRDVPQHDPVARRGF